MLKTAQYRNLGAPSRGPGEVVYVIIGGSCYFSGTKRSTIGIPSTINAAEEVIEAIVGQEKISPESLRFFDLQTHLGYTGKTPGEYDLDELTIKKSESDPDRLHVTAWTPIECQPEILELFKEYIGELEMKIWKPEEALKAGYLPTTTHSPTPGLCISEIRGHEKTLENLKKMSQEMREKTAHIFPSLEMSIMAMIVVDHKDSPEYLKLSEGNRYCMWSRETTQDN